MNIKERYDYLVEEISKHDKLYEQNIPEISDSEYDDLYFELLTIEKDNPDIIRKDSPSQVVKTVLVESLEKRSHEVPMLSQNKIKTKEEVCDFCNDVTGRIMAQEKLDGLTIVLEYLNGSLKCATTRGNGYVGEVVTHNVKTFSNVPKKISFKGKLVLRAEALVLNSIFNKLVAAGAEYSNPRNLASGTLRQLDSKICAERKMIAKVFDLVSAEDVEFENDDDAMKWVKELGFDIVYYELFERNSELKDNIWDFIQNYETSKRSTLDYGIDGIVLKSDNYEEREELGYTSKWPRWATAFKFKSQEATTTLRKVVWQVGKTGQITPVGIFDKINIEVDIERATLVNASYIKDLDLKIGDRISVIRSNDVIPKVTNAIKSKRNGSEVNIEIPDKCPVCGAKTEFNGENLYCTGDSCSAQVEKTIINYASRNAMNIMSLGKETVSLFFKQGYLTGIADIYKLKNHKDEICELEGFGKKKFDNLIKGIEESKKKDLSNLLIALSIRLIADTTAKNVANYFGSIDKLIEKTKDKDIFFAECTNIEDFGEQKTESLYNYFTNEKNLELIEFLKKEGVCTTIEVEEVKSNDFISDKTFVITGDLNIWTNRKALQECITSYGGKCAGSVSKKTNYLINNDSASTSGKNKTAKDLGIAIITEEEFKKLAGL